ncbi:hypothetical protein IWZ01DRAFT_567912 [Phyllosticta capitalensis]
MIPTSLIAAIAVVGVVAVALVLMALLCAGYTPAYCLSRMRKRLCALRNKISWKTEGSAASGAELPQYRARNDSAQPSPTPSPVIPPALSRSASLRVPSISHWPATANSPDRASSPVLAFMSPSPPSPGSRDMARARPRPVGPEMAPKMRLILAAAEGRGRNAGIACPRTSVWLCTAGCKQHNYVLFTLYGRVLTKYSSLWAWTMCSGKTFISVGLLASFSEKSRPLAVKEDRAKLLRSEGTSISELHLPRHQSRSNPRRSTTTSLFVQSLRINYLPFLRPSDSSNCLESHLHDHLEDTCSPQLPFTPIYHEEAEEAARIRSARACNSGQDVLRSESHDLSPKEDRTREIVTALYRNKAQANSQLQRYFDSRTQTSTAANGSFPEPSPQQRDTTSNPTAARQLSCDWYTKGLLEPKPSLETDIIPPRHRRSTLAPIRIPRSSSSPNHERKDTSYQRSAASQISCQSDTESFAVNPQRRDAASHLTTGQSTLVLIRTPRASSSPNSQTRSHHHPASFRFGPGTMSTPGGGSAQLLADRGYPGYRIAVVFCDLQLLMHRWEKNFMGKNQDLAVDLPKSKHIAISGSLITPRA